jgi:hypothetical protein
MRLPVVIRRNGVRYTAPDFATTGSCSSEHLHYTGQPHVFIIASKKFAAYLRSAPKVESSNGKTVNKSTNKAGRKLSITLLSQALNHFRDSNEKLGAWYGRLSI